MCDASHIQHWNFYNCIPSTLYVFPSISKNSSFEWEVAELGVHNFSIHQNDSKLHRSFFIIYICAKCADSIRGKNF